MTREAQRRALELHGGVRVMHGRLSARCSASGSGATADCHEIWILRAMLTGGFTGQLFGEFTKAMRVCGCYVYVRYASRECCEVLVA